MIKLDKTCFFSASKQTFFRKLFPSYASSHLVILLTSKFLSSQPAALIATLYPEPLFILKGSSAHSRLIRVITPPLLVFIIQFPPLMLFWHTRCQSGTLQPSPSPSTVKLFRLCLLPHCVSSPLVTFTLHVSTFRGKPVFGYDMLSCTEWKQ